MSRSSLAVSSPAVLRASLLGLAGLAGAALLAPSAQAAECANGYKVLPNQVVLLCDSGPATTGSLAFNSGVRAPQPVAPAPAVTPGRSLMAESHEDCRPGMYWGYNMVESGDVLLAC